MKYAQTFCTVADLIADAQASGVDDARMFQAISEASDYLQKEIGRFMPVTLTRKFSGKGTKLFVPPLLSATEILNDGVTLSTADYTPKPDDGFWANGPYVTLVVNPNSGVLSCWSQKVDDVVITGRWGLYERLGLTGASVQESTSQSAGSDTLIVSDGGKVSPGMLLLIGGEQQQVTGWASPTANVTALSGAISATDDVLTVDDGALLNIGEIIRVDFEQMRIKDKRGNQCHVARGWNGTGQALHADNTGVDVYRTVNVVREVNGTTASVHLKNSVISRYFVPDDIQFLAKEIATLIVNKAKGGYQGRTGNSELGVVFYHDAFPKADIERVKSGYYIPKAR